jgi:L-idonate 5-dehydrogenase
MRACVAHGAGDLRVDVRSDRSPEPGEVAVNIGFGGICGSDLHYYHRGGVGDFVLREPLVLGHEVVGHVAELGAGVPGPAPGTAVAVHPATPCRECPECLSGQRNICRNTRYLGSAARFPHVQGGFSETLVVPADQIFTLPEGLDLRRAALTEPLAVALHAIGRAGDVAGKRVLVTGAGPIGCLVIAGLAAYGADSILVSDLVDEALAVATAVGATATIRADRAEDPNWPAEVDIAIEASGSAAGLASCTQRVRRGGTIVQLGLLPPGETPLAGNVLVTREITLTGAFRFDTEFGDALRLLADGLYVDPIITQTYPIMSAIEAFDIAGDRSQACKVLLDFSPADTGVEVDLSAIDSTL